MSITVTKHIPTINLFITLESQHLPTISKDISYSKQGKSEATCNKCASVAGTWRHFNSYSCIWILKGKWNSLWLHFAICQRCEMETPWILSLHCMETPWMLSFWICKIENFHLSICSMKKWTWAVNRSYRFWAHYCTLHSGKILVDFNVHFAWVRSAGSRPLI